MGCSSSKSTDVSNETMTTDEAPASKPVLYVDPVSPPCRAVGMVCRLGKIDVDVKELSIFNGEHKTDAMKLINPVGTLPFLVDGELKMNDSQAIAVHLVRKYAPKSKLHGADVQERAKVDELLCDAKEVQTVFYAKMGAVRFGGEGPTDAQMVKVMKIKNQIDDRLDYKLYNLGQYPTIADCFLYNMFISFYFMTNFQVSYRNMGKWSDRLVEAANFKAIEQKVKDLVVGLNKTQPVLYYHPLSPPTRSVHMVALCLNIPLEIKFLDVPKGEHKKPEYLAIQPAGTIPCVGIKADKNFNVEEDFFIGDSNPIATYFANTYAKKSGIYGKDIEQKARVDELLAWEATFRVNMSKFFIHKAFGGAEPTEEQIKKLEDNLDELEARLSDKPFTCGDNLTLADIFISETLLQLEMGRGHKVDKEDKPNIVKFLTTIEKLPCYNAAHKQLNEIRPAMGL